MITAAPSFHAHDDIHFSRMFGGHVAVEQAGEYLFSFDPATWASIVAFVSQTNSGERYRAALLFHQGRDHGHCSAANAEVHPMEVEFAARAEAFQAALQKIDDMCPATADMTLAHEMAAIAWNALNHERKAPTAENGAE